jgi:hypothetical protein
MASLQLAEGRVTEWHPVLSAGLVVRGSVVDGDGALRPGASLYLVSRSTRGRSKSLWSASQNAENGTFRFTGVPDAPFALEVSLAERPGAVVETVRCDAPSDDPIVVRIPDERLAAGTLHGSVAAAAGQSLPDGIELWLLLRGGELRREAVGAERDGGRPFRAADLLPGDYDVSARAPAIGVLSLTRVVLPPAGDVDVGALRLPALVALRVFTDGALGLQQPFERLTMARVERRDDGTLSPSGRPQWFSPGEAPDTLRLVAGTWRWSVRGAGLVDASGIVELVEGVPAELRLVPERGELARFTIRTASAAADGDTTTIFDVRVETAAGRDVASWTVLPPGDGAAAATETWLGAGSYRVRVVERRPGGGDLGRRSETVPFEVPVGGVPVPVDIVVR